MFAKIFTRSNYLDLNDQWVEVEEFRGHIVSLKVYDEVTGSPKTVDVQLREIQEIRNERPSSMIL